jgi:hypothetical protein
MPDKAAIGPDGQCLGSIVTVERAKELLLEIENRLAPHRLLMALQLLQLLNGWPSIVTDNAGKFAQRIIIG